MLRKAQEPAPKRRELRGDALARRVHFGEQDRRATERVRKQRVERDGVAAGAGQLVDVRGPIPVNADEQAAERPRG